jgi:cystathionine beta-lyase
MSQAAGLDRRSFLKNAGLTALAGAVGTTGVSLTVGAVATAASPAPVGNAGNAGTAEPGAKFDFDTPFSRIGTDSTKWDRQIEVYGKDNIAVGMGIADMDFKAAPAITQALSERLRHENWGYLTIPRAFPDGIVQWNKRRHGITVNPDLLAVTTGVHPALIAALRTFSPPGSKVLVQTPTYNGFFSDIRFVGCRAEESPLKLVDGRYSMDFDDLERRISHDTNSLILCNPQNPTGNVWSREDLTRLGEICTRRRVVVLADEIHCDFVNKGHTYTPYATLANKDIVMNSITFKAASKSFGLAAMKCAWYFSDNADYMTRVKANDRVDLTTLGMIASQAAYAGGEEWLNQVVSYIDGNHDFVASYVGAHMPLVKVVKPQGTYLSWLDVSQVAERIGAKALAAEASRNGTTVTPETMVERHFVKHAKVHMNQGASYGQVGAGRMRMNIATSRKTLELALNNLAGALRRL